MASDTGAPWELPYPEDTDLVRDGASDIEALAVAVAAGLSAASVIKNVYYAQMTVVESFSSTSAAFVDLTGLSITLTPESEDSKFLVETVVYGSSAITNLRTGMKARILVGSTGLMDVETLYSASDNNEVVVPLIVSVLDAPGVTTSLTYKVAATQAQSGTSQTVFINRRGSNTDIRALSFLRITEFE